MIRLAARGRTFQATQQHIAMLSLETPARLATIMLVISMVISLLAVYIDFRWLITMVDIAFDIPVDPDYADGVALQYRISMWVRICTTILTAICVMAWLFRARRNLDHAGLRDFSYGPGWAIGAFLIPVVNFGRPIQFAKEISQGSSFLVEGNPLNDWQYTTPTRRATPWWSLYITSMMFGAIATVFTVGEHTMTAFKIAGAVGVIGRLLSVASGVYGLVMIREITATQESAREKLDTTLGLT